MSQKKDKRLLFFRESSYRLARLIFNYPNTLFYIRKMAKETGLSTTGVEGALQEFQEHHLITVQSTNLTKNIQADLNSDAFRFYKRIFNLYQLHSLLEAIKRPFQPKAIVIFGSFAKGEDIEESDVDILIITNRKDEGSLSKIIKITEKELNRTIALHILESLDESEPEFRNAVANGIVVYGYLKVV